jgi:uncharacterized repeat protein (TIGR01451 family)
VPGSTQLTAPAGIGGATYYQTGVNGKPGDVMEYILVIANSGSGVATAVTASDAVPTYTTLVSSSAAYGANNTGGLTGTFAQALRNGTLQAFKVDGSAGSATVGYGKSTNLTGVITFYLGNGSTSSAGGTINAPETDYVVYEVTIK